MANAIKQFRFYSDSDTAKNQPTNIDSRGYYSGTLFENYFPILQLGIQSLPGTKFYLNNATEPIIIGKTGIYELDLEEETEISALQFEKQSIDAIDKNVNSYLIVDIIYDNGEEGHV